MKEGVMIRPIKNDEPPDSSLIARWPQPWRRRYPPRTSRIGRSGSRRPLARQGTGWRMGAHAVAATGGVPDRDRRHRWL